MGINSQSSVFTDGWSSGMPFWIGAGFFSARYRRYVCACVRFSPSTRAPFPYWSGCLAVGLSTALARHGTAVSHIVVLLQIYGKNGLAQTCLILNPSNSRGLKSGHQISFQMPKNSKLFLNLNRNAGWEQPNNELCQVWEHSLGLQGCSYNTNTRLHLY